MTKTTHKNNSGGLMQAKRRQHRSLNIKPGKVVPTLTIIVHGTGAKDEAWWQWGSEFPAFIDQQTGDVFKEADPFKWDGGVFDTERTAGGEALLRWVEKHPTEKLRIVAHSHGGNVAFLASQRGLQIHTLILMGTPIRTDDLPDMNNIKTIYNVYSPDDSIQTLGAQPSPRGTGEARGRILPEASANLKVDGEHSDLHTSVLWKKYNLERLLGRLNAMAIQQELLVREQLLILRVQEGTRQSRLEAILDLARMGSRNALPTLRERLENDEPAVQIYAAYAVYQIAKDKRGVPILLYYLQGPNKDLREGAVYALGLMGKGVLPTLRAALKREPRSSPIRRIVNELEK